MLKYFGIAFFLPLAISAQNALFNQGSIQIHQDGQIGFHADLINNEVFENDFGLVGFYGNQPLTVQGTVSPTFLDVEFFLPGGLFLQNTLNVKNNANFVQGDIESDLNDDSIYLNFVQDAFFTGETDAAKVTGYAAAANRTNFSFPVGDSEQLRPLIMDATNVADLAICGYFFENPSMPLSILAAFDIEQKVRNIGTVSDREFWILRSDAEMQVTLSWNERSNLATIPNARDESIIVVGWSKSANQWTIIGNSVRTGTLQRGFVTSLPFVPNDYEAITIGTIPLPTDTFAVENPTLGNYFLSPNEDGTNDFLVIDGMEESPNNSLMIFNKFGQKVFEQINYTNEFIGMSNTGSFVLKPEIGLPEGIYYYLVTLDDLQLNYQGFIFLDR